MIARVWHGWTRLSSADAYERLLKEEILPGIADRAIDGYHGAHLLRRESGEEVEFTTLLWFESMEGVREFAGEADHEASVVPAEARALLSRHDHRSEHHEVRLSPATS